MSLAPSFHVPRPPVVRLPSPLHRLAAERAARLAVEHGLAETLAFYDELEPAERRVVFGLLARSTPPDPDHDHTSAWWTTDELERAHGFWMRGHRSRWLEAARRIHVRQGKAARRLQRVGG